MNPPSETLINVKTVNVAVVDHLRKMILSGQLTPGQRLVQDELAERLGVSRTPVRDALSRLAHEGLVVISSYKGAVVSRFSLQEMIEIYSIRTALESYATYLAAQSISEKELNILDSMMQDMGSAFNAGDFEKLWETHNQFHASIYRVCDRAQIVDLIQRYLDLAVVYQRMALSMGRGAQDPIIEHTELLDTLRSHEAEKASDLMRHHLELTLGELKHAFEQQENQSLEVD